MSPDRRSDHRQLWDEVDPRVWLLGRETAREVESGRTAGGDFGRKLEVDKRKVTAPIGSRRRETGATSGTRSDVRRSTAIDPIQIGLDVLGNRHKEWNPDRLTALETKR